METDKKSKNLIDSIVACINSCDDGIYTDNRNDNIIKFGGKIGMYQIITHDRCSLLFTNELKNMRYLRYFMAILRKLLLKSLSE